VHHLRRFGFCAYPAEPGTGNFVWIIDEGSTAFRSSSGTFTPPKNWPSDQERKSGGWSPQQVGVPLDPLRAHDGWLSSSRAFPALWEEALTTPARDLIVKLRAIYNHEVSSLAATIEWT
jgi:hypothetical protein